jgi:hypothetical protein
MSRDPLNNRPDVLEITRRTIEPEQQTAAKVAGLAHLIAFAAVVYVNFGIHDHLLVDGSAETARNILAHERLFRIGIAGDLIYCVGVVVLLTALYVILRPVSRHLALLAAFLRLVWMLMWLAMTLNLFEALRLLSGAVYLQSLGAERGQALASLYLSLRFDYYYAGLLSGSLASTVCGYLWFKSRYIPRPLAGFGLISSAFCVVCTFVFYIYLHFDKIVNLWWFDSPMGVFDIALSCWLLFKGIRMPLTE